MIGMKDLPSNGYKPTASRREPTDTIAVAFGCANAMNNNAKRALGGDAGILLAQ